MNWENPPLPWAELERRLSDRTPPTKNPPTKNPPTKTPPTGPGEQPFARAVSPDNPTDDSAPGYKRRRPAYVAQVPAVQRPSGAVVPYAELHCHSNHSFLDGASHPEELVREVIDRLGQWRAVEEHTLVNTVEKMVFKLPRQLAD